MKIGDRVQLADGSDSIVVENGQLIRETSIALQKRTYVVKLIQDGLPSWNLIDNYVACDNNVLLQEEDDASRLVYSQVKFLQSVPPSSGSYDWVASHQAAWKIIQALSLNLAEYTFYDELATILRQEPGLERDTAVAVFIQRITKDHCEPPKKNTLKSFASFKAFYENIIDRKMNHASS